MKNQYRAITLFACVMCSTAAVAKDVAPQSYISDTMRATGGVTLRVEIAQAEIKSDINPSNIAVATGGGLFGALIGAAVDAAKAKKAEELITPLRNALTGFDVDAIAIDTGRTESTDSPWIDAKAATFSKDSSKAGRIAFLDTIAGEKVAFAGFSYDVSPDFSSIRVVEVINIAHKASTNLQGAAIKPDDRLSARNLDYIQSVTSVVSLPEVSKDKAVNAALWAADGGKRARAALTIAFQEVSRRASRSLALTPDQIKAMDGKENKRIVAGGFLGRQVAGEATGATAPVLVWAPGFVSVQTLPDTAPDTPAK